MDLAVWMEGYIMLVEERHREILAIINREGSIKARDIEEKFEVGFDTARRDLRILEEKGLLKRTHGGAIPLVQVGYVPLEGSRLNDVQHARAADKAIAREAVERIKEGDVVYLSGGTLGLLIAEGVLKSGRHVTVVTNAIATSEVLRTSPEVDVFILGGSSSREGITSGYFAEEMVRSMRFDSAFISSAAVSSEFGVSTQAPEAIALMKEVMRSSRKVIGLFPFDRVGGASTIKVCDSVALDYLITDWDATLEEIKIFEEQGIQVIVADPHDTMYQELRQKGHKGWGGQKYEQRMDGWQHKFNWLVETVAPCSGRALEMGCGAGDASVMLAEKGFEVTGVDISPAAIEWAKDKVRQLPFKIEFIAKNVCDTNLLAGSKFDVIVDGCCLHCLFGKDRDRFYENVKRLLSEGGYFMVNSVILNHEGDEMPRVSSIERCFMTESALEAELYERGFKKIQSETRKGEKNSHFTGVFQLV